MAQYGLGRGLDALISRKHPSLPQKGDDNATQSEQGLNSDIDIGSIVANAYQPRHEFDTNQLHELSESIREHGIIQPLVVIREGNGYRLIAGERRLRAAKIVGLTRVPVVIREADDQERLALALIENIQRVDLNPMELARGYQQLYKEFSMTHEEIAKKVGKGRSSVSNMIRLFTLPKEIQEALEEGSIYEGHARLILCLPNSADQLALFKRVINEKLSVAAVERILYEEEKKGTIQRRTPSEKQNFLAQEELLREHLGTKVTIGQKGKRGIISIEFYSPDELKTLLQKMITE